MSDAGGQSRSPTGPEVLRQAIEYFLQDTHTMLPGRFEEYDPAEQRATVKPLVQRRVLTEDGGEFLESVPVIPDVPVMFPSVAGFVMTFPVKQGDFCMLFFAERSIDTYLAGDGSDSDPNDFRMHDLTDCVAMPGLPPFAKARKRADADDMVVGADEGQGVLYFKQDAIHVGAKNAGDAASLDSKVQTELKKLRGDLLALASKYNAHTHTVPAFGIVDGSNIPCTGSATAAAPSDAPTIKNINPTDSKILFIDE